MSIAKVTAIAAYTTPRRGGKLNIIFGASRGEVVDEQAGPSKRVLEMAGAPLYGDIKAPGDGLLLLFGFRDHHEEIRFRRQQSRQAGADFHYAELECDVGQTEPGQIELNHLPDLKFANVKRMSASLQNFIFERFKVYAKGSRGPRLEVPKDISLRPELYSKLCDEVAEFSGLDVLVIPVADNPATPGYARQLAYVRPGVKIAAVNENREISEFVMPDWMLKKRPAAKRAKAVDLGYVDLVAQAKGLAAQQKEAAAAAAAKPPRAPGRNPRA